MSSVHNLMIANGLWNKRRAKEGELIQIDGSPHAWFEERGYFYLALTF